MPRIIAGSAGGRGIKVPPQGTRPTSGRVREALFSLLEAHWGGPDNWNERTVLDLYAGSGALGLEAISRGASRVVLVDSSRQAGRTIRANAAALGFTRQVQVVERPVERVLMGHPSGPFGLVFLDPPYNLELNQIDAVLVRLDHPGWLVPQAVVVVERATRSRAPKWPAGWETLEVRPYGETALHLGVKANDVNYLEQ
ncbi:MAG: 16S rRNA (guanine(966)-N(2))-methyltransferase RsmD [Bifidobacteriaceae bacterium]|jgi:16S rRNA (guanine966-N2)-methyltransferase|nr:16S rRNA (guanine(966)-N(2))-methyltransferase RsmD [Bifidobacteriaceae bacterium]